MPSAWSRLYLRDTVPAIDSGTNELSAVLPVGTFSELITGPRSLSPYKGSVQTSLSLSSIAQVAHQDNFYTSFCSPPLLAGAYGGGAWSAAISASEADAHANSFFVLSVYIYRPSTASVVGYIYDSDTALGIEWGTGELGRGLNFTGTEVTAQNGDILVVEVWRHAVQDLAVSYTQKIYYDGGTEAGNGDPTTDAASWIQAPQEIGFLPHLRRISVT